MFADRIDAGLQLADRLRHLKGREGVVLAIPRGGVPVGFMVAESLGFRLDVLLCKKIGHPHNPEYSIGAVSLTDRVLNLSTGVSTDYIEEETLRLRRRMRENEHAFRKGRPPIALKGKTVVVVDDGIATGSTLLCTLPMLRNQGPDRLIVAVPVAPAAAVRKLRVHADEVVSLLVPDDFMAVGSYYADFTQVEDSEVVAYMERATERDRPNGASSE